MFRLTESVINTAIDNANKILKEVYPRYEIPNIWSIRITNAKSYWANIGRDKNFPNRFGMHISKTFEKIPDLELAKIRFQTCMLHELIHTIPGCNNHGKNFKRIGYLVSRKYPQYDVCTSVNAEEFGVETKERPARYIIKCTKCGKEFRYARKPKYAISNYCCTNCYCDKLIIIPNFIAV